MDHITIAIDGPSGAGKSSLAKLIASRLGISYVDTGAIYRTVGYAVRKYGVDPDDRESVSGILPGISVGAVFEDGVQKMYLDGEYLGDRIRENEISHYASKVSSYPEVREYLLETQRRIARENSVVMDGRDIGTVILPGADVKIFLSADDVCRAARRTSELLERGEKADPGRILAEIRERDLRDSSRAAAPLRPAEDAVLLDNTHLSLEMTLEAAIGIINEKLSSAGTVKTGKLP
ncbi:MAG: (d)CMP kinase [Clostridia bacterium]|nr:(d)CMP kinase [Clostridia bacterium]